LDEDLDLLRRWSGGDTAAGDTLVQRNFPSVFRFLRNKVDDAELDELAQRTFLGCLEGADRFEGRASFRTYLLRIARNQLITHLRERGKQRNVDPEEISVHRLRTPGPGPESLLAIGGERKLLLHALRMLPIEMQVALELHYWERMPVAEIALVVDVPPGTVKSRLHRARTLLRTQILAMEADDALRQETASNLDDWAAALREAIDVPPP
jgi:RNA polymerase sigma-70 factor (ECF subfamily)